MTSNTANALFGYFETLYKLNQDLIHLCGLDSIDDAHQFRQTFDSIVHAIPRLFPLSKEKGLSYKLSKKDGILSLAADLPFIEQEYNTYFEQHRCFLEKVIRIRNKLEHSMHSATVTEASSGSNGYSDITFLIREERYTISTQEIIHFAKKLNEVFSRIQLLLDDYAHEQHKETHPYYLRMNRYLFTNYNKIYESPLLTIIGRALLPF